MSKLSRFKPVNRHLLIVPHVQDNQHSSGVLLPEDYTPDESEYIEATVVDVADDCNKQFNHLKFGRIETEKTVVVDRSMIREVKMSNRSHYLILENYVIGFYKVPGTK